MLKRLIVIVLSIVVLVAYGYLGMDYFKQSREQDELADELSEIKKAIAELPSYTEDYSDELADAEESLAAEYQAISGTADSSAVIYTILTLADEHEVTANPLVTEPWAQENIGGRDYNVFRLHVEILGDYTDVSSFINELEDGAIILVIEDMSITSIDEEVEGAPAGGKPVTASLDLAVYTSAITFD